jgi:hypothetical protein
LSSTATIDTSEWDAAFEVVRAVQPSERSGTDGVAVVTVEGQRRWVAWDERLVMATAPAPAGAGAGVTGLVSPRLVTYADQLAHMDGDVVFTLDGELSSVSSPSGELTLDRPDNQPIPGVGIDEGTVTVARVDPTRLRAFLAAAGQLPWGLERCGPTFWLSVGGGRISAELDWQPWGVPAACFAVPAGTHGPVTRVAIDHRVLLHLAEIADNDDDLVMTVPASGRVIRMMSSRWVADVRTVDFSARSWHPDVDAFFNGGFPYSVVQDDDDGWDIEASGTDVHAALHDGAHRRHVLRLTVTVASDIPSTPDVLLELNALCAGLVNVSVWWHDGDVIAGTDIPCPAVGELAVAAVDNLVDHVAGLGPFVAALAGPA